MPMGMSRNAFVLWKSVLAGAKRRWGPSLSKEIKAQLWAEMSVFHRVGACDYLSLLRDMCRAARRAGVVVGAGRGAAVGSAVCYALGITGIDPIRHRLCFERFMCGQKDEFPDVDFEFDRAGREWVRDYLVSRLGADRVAHIVYRLPEPGANSGLSVHPSAVAISDIPFKRQFTVLTVDGTRLDSRNKVLNLLYADRRQAEAAGLLLIDLLPDEGLTRIRRVLDRIRRRGRSVPNMDRLPFDEVCCELGEDTSDTPIYQEQLDDIIADLADVSFKDAELIRRRLRRGLPCDALANVKEREHLEALAKTDLPMKSHAVSRAYLDYQQAYLKAHYPSIWKAVVRSERSGAQ